MKMKKKEGFFFEKKKQKTFANYGIIMGDFGCWNVCWLVDVGAISQPTDLFGPL
jgi:hypothetical protein